MATFKSMWITKNVIYCDCVIFGYRSTKTTEIGFCTRKHSETLIRLNFKLYLRKLNFENMRKNPTSFDAIKSLKPKRPSTAARKGS